MSESSKQSVYVRFDKDTHERLNQLSQQSGDSMTKLVRMLVERALEQDTSIDILARTQAIATRLGALERQLDQALPGVHERLGALEQLVCGVDANAARRRELDHARQDFLWASSRHGIWELQNLIFHVLELAMASQGHSRVMAAKLHADSQDVSDVGFKDYRTSVEARCAEIEAGAPAALQPLLVPGVASNNTIAIRELGELADAYRRGDPRVIASIGAVGKGHKTAALGPIERAVRLLEPSSNLPHTASGADQPGLFDDGKNDEVLRPTDRNGAEGDARGAGANDAGNGRGEMVP